MRFTRLLLSTLIILLMLFSFNNPTFGGTFREISVDLAKTAAFSYVRQFYGDVSFYSVEPYYDIDGKVAVYEFILASDDSIPPSMNLLKSEINMGNDQIASLQRKTQSIKHLNVNGKAKKIKLVEIQNQINEIKERTCFQDTFVTVLTGATDEHVPIIKCHRGLPERLIRSNGTENSQNFSSGSKRIYYTGMFDQFYELSSSRLINIGTGEIRAFSDIRSEVLQNRKNSELTQEKKSLLKEKWQSIENIYRSDSTHAKPEFNTDKGYELIGNESFTTKAVTASAQLYGESLPNLLPYTFTGWDDKIIVSTQKGVYTNTNPTQYQTVYISVSWGNMGSANAGSHKIYIYYDNSLIKCYELAQLATRYINAMIDLQVIFIQSGQHTLKLVVDKDNQVKESNENDNVYERQIYIQSGNNEGIIKEIPEVPGYNQVDNDCGPVSASKVLAYWDDHPYNGVTYWNLVDHGNSDTGDVSPVEEHPENTGLVADLRRAAGWTHNGGISDLSLKNGILSVCNDSTYGNNLNFTVYRDYQSDYSIIKSEIDNSRPLLYAVQDHPIYEDHFVTVIGYRDSPTYKMVRVKDNWVGNLVQEINWSESTASIIRMTPGGTPSDNYENDDSLAQAKEIYPDDPYKFRQTHNFYKSGDVDYVKFAAQVQRRYIIETKNPGNQSHPSIQLLDSGGNIIATDNSRILWNCQNSSNSPLYVKFQDANNSSGAQTNYDVEVSWEPIEQSQSPQIYVTPSSLTFNALVNDSNPAPQKINIKNTGSDILNWTINDDSAWLSCTPIGGSCTNETDEVTVSVNTTGLTPGTYKANITVNAVGASNNLQTVKVTLNIDSSTPVNLSIMAVAGLNGIITPSGNIQLAYGSSQTFSITPDTGYHIAGVSVDGASVGAVKTYTFTNVASDHTISAAFEINTYILTAKAGANGNISPSGKVKVNHGSGQMFSITPNTGYHIVDVNVDGASVGTITEYTFTNVTANHTIYAVFGIDTYVLTATAGDNGNIFPSGTLKVKYGSNMVFSIIPDKGAKLVDLVVDGKSIGPIISYMLTFISADHTISAVFRPAYVKGDVNGDGVLGIDDAILVLKMLVKLIEPTPQQAIVADLNDDGEIKLDDAIIILQKVNGFGAPDKDAYLTFNGDVCVTLGEVYGSAGKSIIIPLEIDNANVLSGGKVCISYDSSVLHAVDVLSDSDVLMASNANGSGILHIAFANAGMLKGKITARIKFDVINDSTSPIAFKNVELYKPDASPVNSKVVDGKFKSWSTPPEHSFLLQNYPNPFNPETWIPYQLKEDSEVTIRIYNVTGELIREFRLRHKPVGLYVSQDRAVHWDGTNNAGDRVSSGVYFYNIQAGSYSSTKKMIAVQ